VFASTALAARIDRAETRLTESIARAIIASAPELHAFVESISGGVAAFAGPGSPMTKMVGVGFEGSPSEQQLAEIEARFDERGAALQAEVATLADPALAAMLTQRGYVLRNFENVSGRPIADADRAPSPAEGITIDRMMRAEEWIDAAITGFQHPDGKGVRPEELPPREALDAALRQFTRVEGFRRYGAWIEGNLAGVATLRIDDGIAQLCGATTLPAFRRRGIQAALLQRRLADAALEGCDLAVITTQPGSTSQENSHRRGFALLYARAVLIRDAHHTSGTSR
jgi:GNAT superfamily N-acetyltransferase